MGERLKVFGVVALIGFIAGVIAQLTFDYVVPALVALLPAILSAKYIVSGLAGAFLTLIVVSVWAYFTGSAEK
ncbi:MAG: hypothetical protein RMK50_01355 [Nitrososphaerota archaeon]|nr:hypothetical protein [Candidatus Bathyarchaeota archaeon]MDW8193462.1 hypothetical protein [Nitrososphaerota archaeon]